jgi:hypothetical protein
VKRERLVVVVPVTRTGSPGLRYVLARAKLKGWIEANAAELVGQGYRRLIVRPHRQGHGSR